MKVWETPVRPPGAPLKVKRRALAILLQAAYAEKRWVEECEESLPEILLRLALCARVFVS